MDVVLRTVGMGLGWLVFLLPGLGWAGFSMPSNGGFGDGLSDWQVEGDVLAVGGEARLGDGISPGSALWQAVAFPVGELRVEFDFLNVLSPEFEEGSFPDTFFASTYFVDDVGTFDLAGQVYDDAVYLLDLDAGGIFNLSGTVGPSSKGGDWLHYAGEFRNVHAHAVMVFEVYDLDGLPESGSVRVDNVVLAIPEPRSVLLWGVGAMVCMGGRSLGRRIRRIRDGLVPSSGEDNT